MTNDIRSEARSYLLSKGFVQDRSYPPFYGFDNEEGTIRIFFGIEKAYASIYIAPSCSVKASCSISEVELDEYGLHIDTITI